MENVACDNKSDMKVPIISILKLKVDPRDVRWVRYECLFPLFSGLLANGSGFKSSAPMLETLLPGSVNEFKYVDNVV